MRWQIGICAEEGVLEGPVGSWRKIAIALIDAVTTHCIAKGR